MSASAKFAVAVVVSACVSAFAIAADETDKPFQREAAIKLLGYDPEAVDACKTGNSQLTLPPPGTASLEQRVVAYLRTAGEMASLAGACPKIKVSLAEPFEKGTALAPTVCLAAAESARGPLTEHISEMMATQHPDAVAAYADGVARALQTVRDACVAEKEPWAKVAAQALLFENRATTLRQGRTCALWRLALDKELKAATATGESKGKAAAAKYFETHADAALAGAHHYCAADSTASLIDANVDLTKMLIDSMPD